MAIFVSIFTLFFTQAANAEDLWPQVDQFIGSKTLCEAFIDNAEYQVVRETCSMGCDHWLYTIKTFCSENPQSHEQAARIEYWKQNSKFSESKISPAYWSEISGNLLRAKALAAANSGATLTLKSVQNTEDDLRVTYKIDSSFGTVEEGEWLMRHGPAIYQGFLRMETALLPFKEQRKDSIQTKTHAPH